MTIDVVKWSNHLLSAESLREPVDPITTVEPGLTVDDGYAIQDELIATRLRSGEHLVGVKLGLTSKAKQRAMNVTEPCYAVLTDAMFVPAESALDVSGLIHPRIEPEIVLRLGEDLAGPGVTSHDVLNATLAVSAGLEVIDSRYTDFRFTLADVVADNASSARFSLGASHWNVKDLDLALEGCLFEHNGEVVATATGAAVLGHPAEAAALLANWLAARGRKLEAGWVILTGGLTNAVPVKPGDHVTATYAHLGRVSLRIQA